MTIQFRCETLFSRSQNSSDEGHARRKLQVRFNPLLGISSRIAEGVKLQTRSEAALDPFRAPDRNPTPSHIGAARSPADTRHCARTDTTHNDHLMRSQVAEPHPPIPLSHPD